MKAIALISGGLDSLLAAKLIQQQGIEIIPLNFQIPFCPRSSLPGSGDLGEEIKYLDIGNDFLKLLENPQHGFGSLMNPCIDCKILMLRRAGELLGPWGAKFLVTGEVLGQRPMSQHRQALDTIVKKAGLQGLVLRPLSAKLLPETTIEKEGWVSRDKLLSFNGRSRKPQIELAAAFKITEYAQPAGGCLLTDPEFSKKIKDLISHQELNIDNAGLLKTGRHFRISENAKLIVGRNESENARLVSLAKNDDYLFYPGEDLAGPTCLGRGSFNQELIRISCGIAYYYCNRDDQKESGIFYKEPSGKQCFMRVMPLTQEQIQRLKV
jgi:tRNA U34 2-thiouridine synthase MnmA/TrmU